MLKYSVVGVLALFLSYAADAATHTKNPHLENSHKTNGRSEREQQHFIFDTRTFDQVIDLYRDAPVRQDQVCDAHKTANFLNQHWKELKRDHFYRKGEKFSRQCTLCGGIAVQVPCDIRVLPQREMIVFPVSKILTKGAFKTVRPAVKLPENKLVAELVQDYRSKDEKKKIISEHGLQKKFQGEGIAKAPFFEVHSSKSKRFKSYQEYYPGDFAAGYLMRRGLYRVVHQILGAVKSIHDEGFVHRDIKPENILYNIDLNEGEPILSSYLSDFGLASEISQIDGLSGTPAFMAPELVDKFCGIGKNKAIDYKKVDSWAVGLTIAEIMSRFSVVDRLERYHFIVDGFALEPENRPLRGVCTKKSKSQQETFKKILSFEDDGVIANFVNLNCNRFLAEDPSFEGLVCGLLRHDPTERWDMDKALEYLESSLTF